MVGGGINGEFLVNIARLGTHPDQGRSRGFRRRTSWKSSESGIRSPVSQSVSQCASQGKLTEGIVLGRSFR